MHSLDEADFFMELIRDVATELDIDVLCHKILINVCLLTFADRGSLFLARGPADKRYLVAKLFDVTVDTGKRGEARQMTRYHNITLQGLKKLLRKFVKRRSKCPSALGLSDTSPKVRRQSTFITPMRYALEIIIIVL